MARFLTLTAPKFMATLALSGLLFALVAAPASANSWNGHGYAFGRHHGCGQHHTQNFYDNNRPLRVGYGYGAPYMGGYGPYNNGGIINRVLGSNYPNNNHVYYGNGDDWNGIHHGYRRDRNNDGD